MKWALIVAGFLVALVLLVVIVGMLLPRDHVASVSARITASPEAVWFAVTDASSFTTWRHDVTRVDLLPPTAAGPAWREHSRHGAITMEVERADRPRRLVTRIADKNLPYGGGWEFEIEPDGPKASRVTITERGSVYNPVFRFVSRFMMGHTTSLNAYLRALGRRFGNEPTPTVVAAERISDGL